MAGTNAIGRKQFKKGPLINLTDGGETIINQIFSESHRRKISIANKGKLTGSRNPMYNKMVSEETRQKIREKSKNRKHTDETKRKIGIAHKGKIVSEKTKNKLKKPKSDEHKKKISDSTKGRIPWNLGISPTEQTKQKISEGCKGYIHTKEAKEKMGKKWKLTYASDKVVIITNLSTFCSVYDIEYKKLYYYVGRNKMYNKLFFIDKI